MSSARARRLHERFSAHRTVRAVPVLALLAAIVLTLALLIRTTAMMRFDREATHLLQHIRNPGLDRFAMALTFMGNTGTLVTLALLSAAVFALIRRPSQAWMVLLSLSALPVSSVLKMIVDRPRPAADVVDVLAAATGLSFPSGHAAGSAAFYGSLAFIAWTIVANRRKRNWAAGFFALLAVAVGMSRVYLGVHWLSDVLAGWVSGIFMIILLAAFQLPSALARRRESTWGSSTSKHG